jgi:hypothetical protein
MGSISSLPQATALASAQGSFNPQHNNNYQLELQGFTGVDVLAFSVDETSLPKLDVSDLVIQYGNAQVHAAGRYSFGGGRFTFRDYVDRDVMGLLANWFALVVPAITNPDTTAVGLPSDYKKDCYVVLYAADGSSSREWQYLGLWPQTIDFGDMSQAGSAQVMVTISFIYDQAVYLGPST